MKRIIIFFTVVLLLAAFISATGYTPDQAAHDTLYADNIRSKSANIVNVDDDFCVKGQCISTWDDVDKWAGDKPGSIFYLDGNVGIGTETPETYLDVYGGLIQTNVGVRIKQGMSISSLGFSGVNGGYLLLEDLAGNVDVLLTADGDSTFSGNVGIGTEIPTSKLEVVGGPIKATGGLVMQTLGSQAEEDALAALEGQVWLRTDVSGGAAGSGASLPTCADGEVLKYNVGSSAWECAVDDGGSTSLSACLDGEILVYDDVASDWVCSELNAASESLQVLLKQDVVGDTGATQGDVANPRFQSFEITESMLEECRVDIGDNYCYFRNYASPFDADFATDQNSRIFNWPFATKKVLGNWVILLGGDIESVDMNIKIGDGSVRYFSSSKGDWTEGCRWWNINDGQFNDRDGFTICDRSTLTDGTWPNYGLDDTGLWLTIDRQDPRINHFSLIKLSNDTTGSSSGASLPTCADGQVLKYNVGNSAWECAVDDGGLGADTDWTMSGSDMYSGVTGNVGIGTSTPSSKLEVRDGNFKLSASTDDPGDIIFEDSASVQKARIWSEPTAVSGLHLSSGDNTPDISIDSAGDVQVSNQLILGGTGRNSWQTLDCTYVEGYGNPGDSTAYCLAGYVRTGCSLQYNDFYGGTWGTAAQPSGLNGCVCSDGVSWQGEVRCYAYCCRLI
ncbi:MAG: hypothetical protein U9R08_07215 [Nanoarchaeota archaeon]|nr:hypothetical protein [Nanoarchaeota archaeon]